MQTRRISAGELRGCGSLLPSAEAKKATLFRHALTLSCDEPAQCYVTTEKWIVDYDTGMSLLVLYPDEGDAPRVFYLDRTVELNAGVRFSIVPFDQSCTASVFTPSAELPAPAPAPAAPGNLGYTNGLQLERLYTFFYQECARDFFFRGEQHHPYELVYVDKGALHNIIDGTDFRLEQENLLIIDSNAWHVQHSTESVCFITLSFGIRNGTLPACAVNRIFTANAQTRDLIRRMMSEREQKGTYYHDYLEGLLQILLIELTRASASEAVSAPARASLPATVRTGREVLDRAIGVISANLNREMSLQELAAETYVSVSYLSKVFSEYVGMSPGKYMTRLRLEECKSILREDAIQISEVARRMGFSSVQHFSRQFKHCFGITPTEYVKML